MSAWKSLLEAMESDNDRPRTQRMPPPTPGSEKRPPRSYLPGVHRPDSPIRPDRGIKREGPMPTVPAPGATTMPQPSAGEEEQDESKANWSKIAQKRNIARYGSAPGRQRGSDEVERSMHAMKAASTGPKPERLPSPDERRRAEMMRSMIPSGQNVPGGAPNPLFSPPRAASTATARPASGWERLLSPDMGVGDDEPES